MNPRRPVLALCMEEPIALRGGVSVLVEALAEALAERYELVLVTDDTAEAFHATTLASRGITHVSWKPQQAGKASALALAAALKERKVQLANFHSSNLYAWGNRIPGRSAIYHTARSGIPCVHTVHQMPPRLLDGFCGAHRSLLIKLGYFPFAWIGRCLDLMAMKAEVAVSRENAERLQRWYPPFRQKITTIYHSTLPAAPPPPLPRRKWIVALGHIAFKKGQDLLVEAFAPLAARFPDWKLLIIGPLLEEPCVARIQELIAEHRLESRVELLGSRNDAAEFLRQAAVFVQPSLIEALGLALQEALFQGCACIGSATGGIPEQLTDGENGILIPPGDVDALRTALIRLMEDEPLREKLGGRAQEEMAKRKINREAMAEAYRALYTSALSHG